MFWSFLLIVGIVNLIQGQWPYAYEGTGCLLRSRTFYQKGSCVKIRDCDYAQMFIQYNQKPPMCGYDNYEPITCCPIGRKYVRNENNARIPYKPEPSTEKPETRIADEKCDYYNPGDGVVRYALVGGENALSREFPHMAILGYGDSNDIQWLCGGSLISENFVLTAAHCIDSEEFGLVQWVRLGDLDIKNETDDARPQNFHVINRVAHPYYNPPSQYNDIALVQLDRNAHFDEYVNPACIHTGIQLAETWLTATGWGKTAFAGETSSQLQKVNLHEVDNAQCRNAYRTVSRHLLSQGIIEKYQMCASEEGKDTCQGDSGGPLQVREFRRRYVSEIVGVTSFGKACGISGAPGVYTRVAPYSKWIETIVWS